MWMLLFLWRMLLSAFTTSVKFPERVGTSVKIKSTLDPLPARRRRPGRGLQLILHELVQRGCCVGDPQFLGAVGVAVLVHDLREVGVCLEVPRPNWKVQLCDAHTNQGATTRVGSLNDGLTLLVGQQ